jgi:hypothetical protein
VEEEKIAYENHFKEAYWLMKDSPWNLTIYSSHISLK